SFDLGHSRIVLITELHTDTRRPVTLSALRGYPDHFTCHRDLLCFIHQAEQHEDFVAQFVAFAGRDEHTAVRYKWHISSIRDCFIFDGQRENAVARTAANCLHRTTCLTETMGRTLMVLSTTVQPPASDSCWPAAKPPNPGITPPITSAYWGLPRLAAASCW